MKKKKERIENKVIKRENRREYGERECERGGGQDGSTTTAHRETSASSAARDEVRYHLLRLKEAYEEINSDVKGNLSGKGEREVSSNLEVARRAYWIAESAVKPREAPTRSYQERPKKEILVPRKERMAGIGIPKEMTAL